MKFELKEGQVYKFCGPEDSEDHYGTVVLEDGKLVCRGKCKVNANLQVYVDPNGWGDSCVLVVNNWRQLFIPK